LNEKLLNKKIIYSNKNYSTMKNLLKRLGINATELSYLLYISEQTLHTWFNRNSMIPPPYNQYTAPLEVYQQQKKEEDVVLLKTNWLDENQEILATQRTKALKDLKAALQQYTFQLESLKVKESKMLNRWHLSQNYPQYLTAELQNTEPVKDWCSLIGNKSKFKLGDITQAIWKLEQKIAGLEAEVAYWEGK
jgi:virulence-associated protein VapD